MGRDECTVIKRARVVPSAGSPAEQIPPAADSSRYRAIEERRSGIRRRSIASRRRADSSNTRRSADAREEISRPTRSPVNLSRSPAACEHRACTRVRVYACTRVRAAAHVAALNLLPIHSQPAALPVWAITRRGECACAPSRDAITSRRDPARSIVRDVARESAKRLIRV